MTKKRKKTATSRFCFPAPPLQDKKGIKRSKIFPYPPRSRKTQFYSKKGLPPKHKPPYSPRITPMSNIAARVLKNPRACKKQPPAACVASRVARDFKIAAEASEYKWIDFNFIVVGFPHEKEIQDFRRRCHMYRNTAGLIRRRDSLISRFLPSLQTNGLVPKYKAKFVEQLFFDLFYDDDNHEMWNFWHDYCNPKTLSIEKANDQNNFIARKHNERVQLYANLD